MPRKRRSTFWIVSTHLLTTGLAIPALAAWGSSALILYGNIRDPLAELAVQAVCVLVGYVGGTLYSLAYLRGTAQHDNWTACIKPSIIGFVIFVALGFTWSLTQLHERSLLSIGILVLLYVVVIVAFSWLTASAFTRMVSGPTEGASTREFPKKTEAVALKDTRIRRLLLGGGIGFAVGFIMGLGIVIQNDRGGWMPPNGWQTRLLAGFITGGIGMLLGLISGPPRL